MLTHEIQVNETKYSIIITDQIVNQVNNLKSLNLFLITSKNPLILENS